MDLSRTVSAR